MSVHGLASGRAAGGPSPLLGLGVLLALALSSVLPRTAQAGGLYFTDRGARQLGRGGAFVAGADDGNSLWYNPAGLSYAGRQLHLDGTLTFLRASFTRETGDTLSYGPDGAAPTVGIEATKLPIPTLAYTDHFGLDDWSFGLALMAPNALMLSAPEYISVEGQRQPSPQRYSLVSMEGSALANVAVGASWSGIPGLSVGASVHLVYVDRFRVNTYLSACDYGTFCPNPEDAEWDAATTIDLRRKFSLTGNIGLIYEWEQMRFGASLMLPYKVQGDAQLDVNLPSAPLFSNAQVVDPDGDCADQGCTAHMELNFPLVLRTGVEVRPVTGLRLEGGFAWERWSSQKNLTLRPNDISIVGAEGVDKYDVGPVQVKRNMQDVYSMRVGGEYLLPVAPFGVISTIRAGIQYENGAFRNETLQPLTLDSDKVVLGLGASIKVFNQVWLDFTYGHVFLRDRHVTTSQVLPANSLRPPPGPASSDDPDGAASLPRPIGNGRYKMEADFIGAGLRWQIDPPRGHRASQEATPPRWPAPKQAPVPPPPPPPRDTWDSWEDMDEG